MAFLHLRPVSLGFIYLQDGWITDLTQEVGF